MIILLLSTPLHKHTSTIAWIGTGIVYSNFTYTDQQEPAANGQFPMFFHWIGQSLVIFQLGCMLPVRLRIPQQYYRTLKQFPIRLLWLHIIRTNIGHNLEGGTSWKSIYNLMSSPICYSLIHRLINNIFTSIYSYNPSATPRTALPGSCIRWFEKLNFWRKLYFWT